MTSSSTNETTARATPDTSPEFDFDVPGAGLVVNLDSSIPSSISFVGQKIDSWTDQKNSLSFSQAIDATRPTLRLSGIHFNGSQYLSTPAFSGLALTSAMTILTVATPENIIAPASSGIVAHSSGVNGYLFRYGQAPAGEARFNFPAVQDISANVVSFESGIRSVIGVIFGGGNFIYRKNGNQLGITNNFGGSAIYANVPTVIGADQAGNEGWLGTINQILIYNTRLNVNDLADVEQALIKKWTL